MPPRLQSLQDIHAECWRQLNQAAHEPQHGWRRMSLATVTTPASEEEAALPEVRSVVLRETLGDERQLVFYTDSRSPKVAQLRSRPLASLLAWCPALGWQLRLRVRVAIDASGLSVSSRWAQMKLHPSAQDYLSPLPPGSRIAEDQPVRRLDRDSRANFAVAFATVEAVDWLELHAEGHRRALFDAAGEGHWVAP